MATIGSTQVSTTAQKKGNSKVSRKGWFLTFPQNLTSKQEALSRLQTKFQQTGNTISWVRIAQELHQTGEPHLHIALMLEKPLSTRVSTFFDFVGGKHGNYQNMKSIQGSLAYCEKSDQTPLDFGTIPKPDSGKRKSDSPTAGDSKRSKSSIVAEKLMSGCSMDQICDQDPGYFLLFQPKIADFSSYWQTRQKGQSLTPHPGKIYYSGQDLNTQRVVEWLNQNLFSVRPFKQQQLYLHGPPNTRKTSLVALLRPYFNIMDIDYQEDFYCQYTPQVDLMFFDEFKGQKMVTHLNKLIEGSPVPLKRKFKAPTTKTRNNAVIFCSNYAPHLAYSKIISMALDSFLARLLVIELTEPLDLDNVYHAPVVTRLTESEFCDQEWKSIQRLTSGSSDLEGNLSDSNAVLSSTLESLNHRLNRRRLEKLSEDDN